MQGGSILKYNGSGFQLFMNDSLKAQHIDLNDFLGEHKSYKSPYFVKYYHSNVFVTTKDEKHKFTSVEYNLETGKKNTNSAFYNYYNGVKNRSWLPFGSA